MHWKRATQNILRSVRSAYGLPLQDWRVQARRDLSLPVPADFSGALFNFTVDFELFWGNGNLGGYAHDLPRRIRAAKKQAENFFPFVEMLREEGFPVSWAVLGCLAEPFAPLPATARFKPRWASEDWYALPEELLPRESLWIGDRYLAELRDLPGHEILSHGFAHIDYADEAATEEVAWQDLLLGRSALERAGLKPQGFVFPFNSRAHDELLNRAEIPIARGSDAHWHRGNGTVFTPRGFWISPGVYSFREARTLIDEGIRNRSFVHPWMHLIECEIRCRDIQDFYRPLFRHVLEQQARGRIQNVSFRQIANVLSSRGES